MPETHFPNQEDETNFKTRLRRGSRCVFLGQRRWCLGSHPRGLAGRCFRSVGTTTGRGSGGPVEVQPVKVGDFSTKKDSVHVLSAMEISLG